MARRFRFDRSMLNGHPGNVARAVRRVIIRGVNHGLIVTSTTDGIHASRSWHKILPPRNFRGRAVDFGHGRPGTPEARAALVAFQRDLTQTHGADKFHEVFGPDNAFNVKNGVIVGLVEGTPLETAHDNHLHVAPKLEIPLPTLRRRKRPAKGIDVSNHQGIVDFAKVKAAGYEFAYLKAGEGATFLDPTFPANVRAARAAGVRPGAYWFLRPRLDRSGAVEARVFHQRLKETGLGKGDLRPAIDIEVADGLSSSAVERYTLQFAVELERLGHARPVLYTFPAFLSWSPAVLKYPLWIAHFNVERPTVPKPWREYAAWQFSSSATVPGVTGRCDVNRCPDLRRLIA